MSNNPIFKRSLDISLRILLGLEDTVDSSPLFAGRSQYFRGDRATRLSRAPLAARDVLLRVVRELTDGARTASLYENYMNLSVFLGSTGELSAGGRLVSGLNGVEERLPFTDQRLLEFMQGVPAVLKGSEALVRKRELLRNAFSASEPMASRIPSSGALPGFPWQASAWLQPLVVKQATRLAEEGELLAPDLSRKIMNKYKRRGARRAAKSVWLLFVLQTWFDLNLARRDPFEEVDA